MNLTKTVKIKTWKQMEKEFGLNSFNDIKCSEGFTLLMEKLIPENRIIEVKEIDGFPDKKLEWNSGYRSGNWNISKEMIEEIIKD